MEYVNLEHKIKNNTGRLTNMMAKKFQVYRIRQIRVNLQVFKNVLQVSSIHVFPKPLVE